MASALVAIAGFGLAAAILFFGSWWLRGIVDKHKTETERDSNYDTLRDEADQTSRLLSLAASKVYFAREQAEQIVRDFDDPGIPIEPINQGRLFQAKATLDALKDPASTRVPTGDWLNTEERH